MLAQTVMIKMLSENSDRCSQCEKFALKRKLLQILWLGAREGKGNPIYGYDPGRRALTEQRGYCTALKIENKTGNKETLVAGICLEAKDDQSRRIFGSW